MAGSNVAFKCTYCDGGQCADHIGFSGVCSEETIRYNIKVKNHVWCCESDCDCWKYYNGKKLYARVAKVPCYESRLLENWVMCSGIYHNGDRRDQPIPMHQARKNSLCVLTTREPRKSERERIIFGVFLIGKFEPATTAESAIVTADAAYKIVLTPDEAQEMKFWKFHANENSPSVARWNTGLFRYLTFEVSAQILRAIVDVKKKTGNAKSAQNFFNHFCEIHGIDQSKLPEPNGAIKE